MHLSMVLLSVLANFTLYTTSVIADLSYHRPGNFFDECSMELQKLSCITDKASSAVENAIDMDLQIVPGLVLLRNDHQVEEFTGRDQKYGLDRLVSSLKNFFATHYLSLDTLKDGRQLGKRPRRRYGFLLAALMSGFGITNTMVLSSLAVIAGKALMVSKMALMISGIIGLKKLFSKEDHQESVVQVHTLHDEHDRNVNSAMYNIRHL